MNGFSYSSAAPPPQNTQMNGFSYSSAAPPLQNTQMNGFSYSSAATPPQNYSFGSAASPPLPAGVTRAFGANLNNSNNNNNNEQPNNAQNGVQFDFFSAPAPNNRPESLHFDPFASSTGSLFSCERKASDQAVRQVSRQVSFNHSAKTRDKVAMDLLSMDTDSMDVVYPPIIPSWQQQPQEQQSQSITMNLTNDQKMDLLFQYKKVDGSFSYSPTSLHILGWSNAAIASFASSHGISEEMAFNLWILKFLRSDVMKSSKKYVMILRNLERWVNEQLILATGGKINNLNTLLIAVGVVVG
jgi:hypothetical protein